MSGPPFSLILLPTLQCNAECDYCFERKSNAHLSLDQLRVVIQAVLEHLERSRIETLFIYWQGGEVMTLPPEWFLRADEIIRELAAAKSRQVVHYLQSNLLAYGPRWNRVISEMFGGSVGSSMDYPNLYRKASGGGPKEYENLWTRKVRDAKEAGIRVGIIALPNHLTLEAGAEQFYARLVDELDITDIQVNTPFPGGPANAVKTAYPLDAPRLSAFLQDLAAIWMEKGPLKGVRVSPFDRLLRFFTDGINDLVCIWRENCAKEFVCIDPSGNVAQCDCWVTSYPDARFGNIFDGSSLTELLSKSPARRQLLARPGVLIEKEDCLECDYLSLCHGGCPVRAYSVYGSLFRKDPYCEVYKALFLGMERAARSHPSTLDQEGDARSAMIEAETITAE